MQLKGGQSTSRAINRRLILNLLRAKGATSRAGLAALTGLSPAAVTFVVSELLSERILVEGEGHRRAPGRRPIPVDINYRGRLAVGVKVMAGSIDCVLTDLSTSTIEPLHLRVAEMTPDGVIDAISTAVRRFGKTARKIGAEIYGIGVSIPGRVEPRSGVCLVSHRLGWRDVPVARMLADKVQMPVWVDDDTNAFALAQQLFGETRDHHTAGALAVGVGIACSVVVGGAVHHGATGGAGKLGHALHDPNGPVCECGRRGCLQTLYSVPAIVARWRDAEGLGPETTQHDLIAASGRGEAGALSVLEDAGQVIGHYLGLFCIIVDPKVIVVGGEVVEFGEAFLEPLRRAVAEEVPQVPPRIVADWTEASWARGAAALATQNLFDFEAVAGTMKEASDGRR